MVWPAAVHRYIRSLAEKTSRLSLLGFGKGLQVELPIERAWVPLRVLWTEIAGELRRDRALQEQGERLPVDVNASGWDNALEASERSQAGVPLLFRGGGWGW